jgi:hypothetical protein
MADEVVAQVSEPQRQTPDATQQLFAIQTFEHHAYGEEVSQLTGASPPRACDSRQANMPAQPGNSSASRCR